MNLEEVTSMIRDLDETAKRWDFQPRFQISGGEPMLREDLYKILRFTQEIGMETRILTNGTLITPKRASKLKELGINRLQISIDGNKDMHNTIRSKPWAYDLAMAGVNNCKNVKIDVTVSMTAMNSNKGDFEQVIVDSIKAGAKYVGFQSYVPDKVLGLRDPEFIGPEDTYKLFQKTRELDKLYGKKIKILQTEVLWQIMQWDTKLKQQAREEKKFLSGCGAGFSGISVLSDGTVYPCRRLPIVVGNIREGFANIMLNSKVLKDLRDFNSIMEKGCCDNAFYCRGCRAVAYAVTGDYMAKDPMCFKHLVNSEDIAPRVIRR